MFRPLQCIHENIYHNGEYQWDNPLSLGNFVIVMHPKSKEVVLGEGELIYCDWLLNIPPNEIIFKSLQCIQQVVLKTLSTNGSCQQLVLVSHCILTYKFYTHSLGILSSLLCMLLGWSSFLWVSCNQILFFLASCVISQSDNTTLAGQPNILATLPPICCQYLAPLAVCVCWNIFVYQGAEYIDKG